MKEVLIKCNISKKKFKMKNKGERVGQTVGITDWSGGIRVFSDWSCVISVISDWSQAQVQHYT